MVRRTMSTIPFCVPVTLLLFMRVCVAAQAEFSHFKTSTDFGDLYCPAPDAQPGIVVSLSDCGNRCSGPGDECLGFFYNSATRACNLRLPAGPDSSVCGPEPDSIYYGRKTAQCGTPPTLPFASVSSGGTYEGSVSQYTCQPGYVVKMGDVVTTSTTADMTCQSDGSWGEGFECVMECPRVTTVPHASVQGAVFLVGSSLSVICNPGYLQDGPELLTCLASGQWSDTIPTCTEDPVCVVYMVDGPGGVSDSQISASSYWCDTYDGITIPGCLAPKYARLSVTGWDTGAWVPSTQDENQWIQVDFDESRVITGIALAPRDPYLGINEWVTSFKVSTSSNCIDWDVIADETGSPQVFDGTSGPTTTVERPLTERAVARCVRVNPITWNTQLALRFDVLGCTL